MAERRSFGNIQWYNDHSEYMKLAPKTRETVNDILGKIKEKLTEEKILAF